MYPLCLAEHAGSDCQDTAGNKGYSKDGIINKLVDTILYVADPGNFRLGFKPQAKHHGQGLQKKRPNNEAHGNHVQGKVKTFHVRARVGSIFPGLLAFFQRGFRSGSPVGPARNDQSHANSAINGGNNDISPQVSVHMAEEESKTHHTNYEYVEWFGENMIGL